MGLINAEIVVILISVGNNFKATRWNVFSEEFEIYASFG
jgi:hypothetical protein